MCSPHVYRFRCCSRRDRHMPRRTSRRTTRFRMAVSALAVALPVAFVSVGVTGAGAVTGATDAPVNLPATASPIWQTNDAVWALAYLPRANGRGIVFAGGDFTKVRPPGAVKGDTTKEKSIVQVAAFDATTGAPCIAPSPCPDGFVFNSTGAGG